MKTKKRLLIFCTAGVAVFAAVISVLVLMANKNSLVKAASAADTIIINAEYDNAAHAITATQTIKYKNRSDAMIDCVKFHIYANAYRDGARYAPVTSADVPKAYPNGKSFGGIDIRHIQIDKIDTQINIEGDDNTVLSVPLAKPLYPTETVTVDLNYTIQLANIRHRLGYTERCVNLGNFYPVPCVYEDGKWQTYPYSFNGDPFYNDLHNFDVTLKCDKDFTVASSGALFKETASGGNKKILQYQSKAIRDFAMVLSKQFKSLTRLVNKVAVNYFYLEDSNPEASIATSTAALTTFSRLFTKYPYKQLTVVQTDFLHGGMEYGELVYISTDITARSERDQVIVHEIAHQWWYGIVGNNQTKTALIDEGLAEYSTLVFYGENPSYKIDCKELLNNSRSNYAAYLKISHQVNTEVETEMNRDLNSFNNSYEYVFMTYVRGLLLFADLEFYIGKTKVLNALSDFAKEAKFSFARQEMLVRTFERSTRTKLKVYFNTYLTGVPE